MNRAYFAVFDGHGGVDAARYAAVHVHVNAARQPELPVDPERALREAFRRTDEMFLWKAKREVRTGGPTSCAVWGLVAISIGEPQSCRGIEIEVVGGAGRSLLNATGSHVVSFSQPRGLVFHLSRSHIKLAADPAWPCCNVDLPHCRGYAGLMGKTGCLC